MAVVVAEGRPIPVPSPDLRHLPHSTRARFSHRSRPPASTDPTLPTLPTPLPARPPRVDRSEFGKHRTDSMGTAPVTAPVTATGTETGTGMATATGTGRAAVAVAAAVVVAVAVVAVAVTVPPLRTPFPIPSFPTRSLDPRI